MASSSSSWSKSNAKLKDMLYCYCRRPYADRFMICCDDCNKWYHGDCVQITRTMAKKIAKYYCPSCTAANPNRKTANFTCHFSVARRSPKETKERPMNSEVSQNCHGKLVKMTSLIGEKGNHGADNAMLLVVARGLGEFYPHIEHSDALICEAHVRELLTEYDHIYRHYPRIARDREISNRCVYPTEKEHAVRGTNTVTYKMSKALLEDSGVLLHPGSAICVTHSIEISRISRR